MSVKLKIKAKHLATEPAIIRKEVKKAGKRGLHFLANQLHQHKVDVVRPEARATELARAYIAGKPYNTVERYRKPEKEWYFDCKIIPRVLKMVQKYHKRSVTNDDIRKWVNQ